MNELVEAVLAFRDERDWRQFHNPKDLAISISLEAAELLEHFQWKTAAEVEVAVQSGTERKAIGQEMADILILLISMSDAVGVDLIAAAKQKLIENGRKYPVDRAKGNARKYDDLA